MVGKKEFLKTEIARCIWLLFGLVRSLKSSHKEAPRKPLLCEDNRDLTSPTRNQIPDVHMAVSVVNDTIKKHFSSIHVQFHCEMKVSVLLI